MNPTPYLGRPNLKAMALAVVLSAVLASTAHATITVQDEYLLGEQDGPLASNGNPVIESIDETGNNNLTVVSGTPTYSSNVDPGIGSTLSVDFGSTANALATASNITIPATNFGFEGWFDFTGSAAGNQQIVYLGTGTGQGAGLYDLSGEWSILVGSQATDESGVAITPGWTYVALVYQNGDATFYINGDTATATLTGVQSPYDNYDQGLSLGVGGFNGLADDVEYFTFAPGQFSPSNLSINNPPTVVPEPSQITLLFLGAGALALVYRLRARRA